MDEQDSYLNSFRLKVLTRYVRATLDCETFELVPIAGGFSRRTYLVKCESGAKYILQVAGGSKVSRNNLGVALNKMLHSRGGFAPEVISGPDPLDELSSSACIFAFLPGAHRNVLSPEEAYELGAFLGRMHQSIAGVTDLDIDESNAVSYRLTLRAYRFIFKDFMLRSIGLFRLVLVEGVRLGIACLGARSQWLRRSSELSVSLPSGYNHGDLNEKNILFSECGVEVSGLIDFEKVVYRPFIFDVAEVLSLVVCNGEGDTKLSNVNVFLDGYKTARAITEGELRELPDLVVLRCRLIIFQALISWAGGENLELSKQLKHIKSLSAGLHNMEFSPGSAGVRGN